MKRVLHGRGLGISENKCLYEGVIVWGMRSCERRNVKMLDQKCLRSLVGLTGMISVENEEVPEELE